MRAVNLVPKDARRVRSGSGGQGRLNPGSLGPAHLVVAVLVVVVGLVLLRVVAGNTVNDKQATLAAVQTEVATEQSQASKFDAYTSFVQAAQQREMQVRDLVQQRFPWQRTLDQISRVMPATTSLTSLSANSDGASTASSTSGVPSTGPSFTLAGCAHTANQDGVAILLRRLRLLTGVTSVNFQSSTRTAGCGDTFNIGLTFSSPPSGTSEPSATSTAATSALSPATTSSTTSTTAAAEAGSQ